MPVEPRRRTIYLENIEEYKANHDLPMQLDTSVLSGDQTWKTESEIDSESLTESKSLSPDRDKFMLSFKDLKTQVW